MNGKINPHKRGFKLPTEVKEANGTLRKCREKPVINIEPIVKQIEIPDVLNEVGAGEWSKIIGLLDSHGVIRGTDETALLNYCLCYQTMIRLANLARDSDPVIFDDKGRIVKNPIYSLLNEYQGRLLMLSKELGLTPASRGRIEAMKVEVIENNEFDEF